MLGDGRIQNDLQLCQGLMVVDCCPAVMQRQWNSWYVLWVFMPARGRGHAGPVSSSYAVIQLYCFVWLSFLLSVLQGLANN